MTKTFREKEIQAMRTALEMNGVVSLDDDAVKRILVDFFGWWQEDTTTPVSPLSEEEEGYNDPTISLMRLGTKAVPDY